MQPLWREIPGRGLCEHICAGWRKQIKLERKIAKKILKKVLTGCRYRVRLVFSIWTETFIRPFRKEKGQGFERDFEDVYVALNCFRTVLGVRLVDRWQFIAAVFLLLFFKYIYPTASRIGLSVYDCQFAISRLESSIENRIPKIALGSQLSWLERTPDKREVGSSSLPGPTPLIIDYFLLIIGGRFRFVQ